MNRKSKATHLWQPLLLFLLAGLAFSMACRLTSAKELSSTQEQSIFSVLLGQGRSALSTGMYDRSDIYFHKGVVSVRPVGISNTWFQVLAEDIAPTRHQHLQGKSISETMPWLRFATQADPSNVEAWLVAAFWMMMDGKRPDLAEQILEEARRANPADYEIQLEFGRLYLRQNRIDQARDAFDRGLRFWPSGRDTSKARTRLDKCELLILRALLYEVDRKPLRAAELYEEAQSLHAKAAFARRIKALRTNEEPSLHAKQIWEEMLRSKEEQHCQRENNEHADANAPH